MENHLADCHLHLNSDCHYLGSNQLHVDYNISKISSKWEMRRRRSWLNSSVFSCAQMVWNGMWMAEAPIFRAGAMSLLKLLPTITSCSGLTSNSLQRWRYASGVLLLTMLTTSKYRCKPERHNLFSWSISSPFVKTAKRYFLSLVLASEFSEGSWLSDVSEPFEAFLSLSFANVFSTPSKGLASTWSNDLPASTMRPINRADALPSLTLMAF